MAGTLKTIHGNHHLFFVWRIMLLRNSNQKLFTLTPGKSVSRSSTWFKARTLRCCELFSCSKFGMHNAGRWRNCFELETLFVWTWYSNSPRKNEEGQIHPPPRQNTSMYVDFNHHATFNSTPSRTSTIFHGVNTNLAPRVSSSHLWCDEWSFHRWPLQLRYLPGRFGRFEEMTSGGYREELPLFNMQSLRENRD